MRIAVVGAGALGSVYGVRLALRGGVDVAWVVRPTRLASRSPIVIERVRGDARDAIDTPHRTAVVPDDADVILLAVGTEDLDAIQPILAPSRAPVVVLTPMLPAGWARMRAEFGERVLAAMPNVVAYARPDDGVIRYWLPPAPTRIEEPRAGDPHREVITALVHHLVEAGLHARLELAVHEKNPATTVSFIALGMALSISGSAKALAEDRALGALAARACREGVELGRRIGSPEPWAVLAPLLARPWCVGAALRALARLSPEALFYAEEHFGRKLRAQHRDMIRSIVALAEEKGTAHDAFDELADRLG